MAFVKNFQHDVFISYAHADNSADAADEHWVSQFKRKLQAALTQRLGGSDDLAIFFDDTHLNSNHQLDKLLAAAGNSALFLAIASPSYAQRDWTKKELDAFIATKPDLDRLFAVECLPYKGKTYPAPLQSHMRMEFWQTDAHSATPMPLSPATDTVEFNRLIQQLAMQIQQELETLAESPPIAPLSGSNQQTPGLQEQHKTYVPNFHHDVLVSYAAEDESWAKGLSDYLRKPLKQKLGTADGFQITTTSEFSAINTAATLLVIASPAYYRQHHTELGQMDDAVKQKTVFLVEYQPCPHSGCLNGLTRHKFWVDDDVQGIIPIIDDAYFFMVNKLSDVIADRLKELKTQQEQWQYMENQRLERLQSHLNDNPSLAASVFLYSTPEDLPLAQEVASLLVQREISYNLSLELSDQIFSSSRRIVIENAILKCDAILILYEQMPWGWVQFLLALCDAVELQHNKSFKVIAIHRAPDTLDLGVQQIALKIYSCPPEKIETYLPDFIEALL